MVQMIAPDYLPLILYFCLINVVTTAAFAWDKHCARKGYWRISESTLLAMALFGGTAGAVAAQHGLRHKTRKEPFRTALYVIAGFHLVVLAALSSAPVRETLRTAVGRLEATR